MKTQNDQATELTWPPRPYTIQELEAKYGTAGALVIWQMRQQDFPVAK